MTGSRAAPAALLPHGATAEAAAIATGRPGVNGRWCRVSAAGLRRLLAAGLLTLAVTLLGAAPAVAIPPELLKAAERGFASARSNLGAARSQSARPSAPSLGEGALAASDAGAQAASRQVLVNDPGLDHVQSFAGEEPVVFVTQSETSVAASGNDRVVGYNSSAGLVLSEPEQFSQLLFDGYSVSHDRGRTWTSGFIPAPPGESVPFTAGDPSVGVDRAGNFYYLSINSPGLQINKSSDRGDTWSPGRTLVKDLFSDKPWMAIGPDPAIPSRDDIYVTWARLTHPGCQLWLASSIDGGKKWTKKLLYAPEETEALSSCAQFSNPTVDPSSGRLYVPFLQFSTTDADVIKVLVSDDGGATFSFLSFNVPEAPEPTAFPNVTPGTLEDCGERTDLQLALHQGPSSAGRFGLRRWARTTRLITQPAAAAVNGRLFLAINSSTSSEFGAGTGSSIRLLYSPDGGETWAAPVTVAASTPSSPQHVLPAIAVDPTGSRVDVVYYLQQANGRVRVDAAHGTVTEGAVSFGGETQLTPPFNMAPTNIAVSPTETRNFDSILPSCYNLGEYLSVSRTETGLAAAYGTNSRRFTEPPERTLIQGIHSQADVFFHEIEESGTSEARNGG